MKKCTECGKLVKDEDVVIKPRETEREYLDMVHSMITMPGEAYPYPRDTRPIECHELEKERALDYRDFPVYTKYCGPLRELTSEEGQELEASGGV